MIKIYWILETSSTTIIKKKVSTKMNYRLLNWKKKKKRKPLPKLPSGKRTSNAKNNPFNQNQIIRASNNQPSNKNKASSSIKAMSISPSPPTAQKKDRSPDRTYSSMPRSFILPELNSENSLTTWRTSSLPGAVSSHRGHGQDYPRIPSSSTNPTITNQMNKTKTR